MKTKITHYVLSLFAICLLGIANLNAQTFTDPDDLIDAVNAAGTTGGTFILANGSYSNFEGGFTDLKATASKPIIIKAATVGGVTLTGESYFSFKKCSYITVEGFNIMATGTSTLVKLEGSNNIRISRNVFDLTTTEPIKWVYIGGIYDDIVFPYLNPSHHNRIDHNIFQNKTTAGHYITIDGNNEKHQSQYDRIDHNYFKDNVGRAVNEKESIRVGWSEMSKSSGFTTVEYNLFEKCDGDPEIVSVKSCDNVIRHNTFKDNFGTLSFRHGNRNKAEGNYFFGGRPVTSVIVTNPETNEQIPTTLYTGGMRLYGTDHLIINNYFEGLNGTRWDAPITITQGDAKEESSSDLTKHFIPKNMVIAYNTLVNNDNGIEIGFDNNDNYKLKVENVKIANNLITGSKNSLIKIVENDQDTAINWANNLFYPTGTATVVAGGTTTTSFIASQATNENPNLVYNSTDKLWRSTVTTPSYANASGVTNNVDVDGQTRTEPSNVGADQFSAASVRYMPMTTTTVGPNAYGDESTDTELPDFKTLSVSTLAQFTTAAGTGSITVTSNQTWTAAITTSGASWLSLTSATTGTGNGSLGVAVTANTSANPRSAVITFTAGDLTITSTVSQAGVVIVVDPINVGAGGLPVTIISNTNTQAGSNAANTLDKLTSTKWSDDGTGSATTPYGVLVYDLGAVYDMSSISIATTGTASKLYYYSIQFSVDGVNYTAKTDVTSDLGTAFKSFSFTDVARYVKITGGGNNANTAFTSISEINFYGSVNLSANKYNANSIAIYPIPAKQILNIDLGDKEFTAVVVYSMDGKLVKTVNTNVSKTTSLDVSAFANGMYVLKILNKNEVVGSKQFIVSH